MWITLYTYWSRHLSYFWLKSIEIEAAKRAEIELDKEDDHEDIDEEEYDKESEVTRVNDLQQQLNDILSNLSENNGRLSDDLVNRLLSSCH